MPVRVINPSYKFIAVLSRLAVASACLAGAWWSLTAARADYLARLNSVESLRKAVSLAPDEPRYYKRLAQLDPDHSTELLRTAIRLNPYDAAGTTDLALQLEAAGDYNEAEKLLLHAFEIDRTYLPRWSLANFYLRRQNMPVFWYVGSQSG